MKTWYPFNYFSHKSIKGNLVPRACDPWEGNEGSGIIRCRKPGILAKIELRIHFNGQSDSSLKRIIPEPSFPSQGSQARGTRLYQGLKGSKFSLHKYFIKCLPLYYHNLHCAAIVLLQEGIGWLHVGHLSEWVFNPSSD